jgi:dihydrofolate synthase/folylpolyglutamate synthase
VTAARAWIWSLETLGIKLGLEAMRALLQGLDHPEQRFRSIIVAGTNGKGSVTAMLERGLREAGVRTGRYTSPHLVRIEERIAINGDAISEAAFDVAAARVRAATTAWETPPSFFEATTALALDAFRSAEVDIAVLEVGLGGRLDATNVVAAPLAVITRIGLDHQAYLGDTLTAIAREKAGVIAPGAHVVVAPNSAEARAEIDAKATTQRAQIHDAEAMAVQHVRADARGTTLDLSSPSGSWDELRIALAGRHQIDNARTAICALGVAADLDWISCTDAVVRTAVGDVVWPARLEWRRFAGRDVLVDGAHNADGADALASFLTAHVSTPVTLVVGVMRDKDVEGMLRPLLSRASSVVATAVPGTRALEAARLADACRRLRPDLRVDSAPTPEAALEEASRREGLILVAGSLYLAGHVRAVLA